MVWTPRYSSLRLFRLSSPVTSTVEVPKWNIWRLMSCRVTSCAWHLNALTQFPIIRLTHDMWPGFPMELNLENELIAFRRDAAEYENELLKALNEESIAPSVFHDLANKVCFQFDCWTSLIGVMCVGNLTPCHVLSDPVHQNYGRRLCWV